MDAITADTFFDKRLLVRQFRDGYRFSIDAVILAGHICPRAGETILELGAGCGIVSLMVAFRHAAAVLTGVEIQPELAGLARANALANGLQARVRFLGRDMKTLAPPHLPGPFDWVVSNPPYRKTTSGRLNPQLQRAIARHEITVSLTDVISAARRWLRTGGRFVTVYTAERMAEALSRMQASGIEPKYCRMIHSTGTSAAKLVLIEAHRGARPGLIVAPPLVIYKENGDYTAEMESLFRP